MISCKFVVPVLIAYKNWNHELTQNHTKREENNEEDRSQRTLIFGRRTNRGGSSIEEMKTIVLGFLIFISMFILALWFQKPVESHSLLGKWEGKDPQGNIEVLLTVDPGELVVEYVESGKSHKNSYLLSEGARNREMKVEDFEEKLFVNFVDGDTMDLDLSDADARKISVPLITTLTYYRKK